MSAEVIIVNILTLASLIFIGIQAYLIYKTNKDNQEWRRRIASQNAINDINNGDTITELNEIFNTLNLTEAIPIKIIRSQITKDKSIQVKINHILNSYEAISRGIYNGIYDEKIIKEARRGLIIKQYNIYCNYIKERREISNQKAYTQLEALVNRWKDEKTTSTPRAKIG